MNKNNRYTYIRLVRTLCGTITLAGLASCASTSGGTYSRSAQGDSSATSIAAQRKKDSQPTPSKPPPLRNAPVPRLPPGNPPGSTYPSGPHARRTVRSSSGACRREPGSTWTASVSGEIPPAWRLETDT